MVNEAVLLKQYSIPTSVSVADGTGIEKGTLLVLSDPNTAAAAPTTPDDPLVAGIAVVDKIANDGHTKLAVAIDGEYRVLLSGACAVGDQLGIEGGTDGGNIVASQAEKYTLSGTRTIGIALETGTNTQTIRMRLAPQETDFKTAA
jgi:hypothetical protein|tara:strand:+ start:434 stop:871 length:438 start_codon:yes stop_codon:yes gene_type:complete